MSEPSTRRYDSTLRRERSRRTRARVVETAGLLFVERGYVGTTIPAIAAEAGVAVETVYRCASGKAGLLADAVRAAVAGGAERAEVPVGQRAAVRRLHEEPDPHRVLALYAATQPGIWSRVGPLLAVLDAAASTDTSLRELRDTIAAERRAGLRQGFGRMLLERGMLREGLTAERAGDIVYAVCGRANHDALVGDCGWSADEYEGWLVETLSAALLAP